MHAVANAKNLMLAPRTAWPMIAAEPATVSELYRNWLVYLAAIPAVAAFIGFSLLGLGIGPLRIKTPIGAGLATMLASFVFTLVIAYVMAWIVNALAPVFGGERNMINAVKLVAFSATPSLLAGALYIMPMLGFLMIFAAIYGMYLMYTGLPVLMKNAPGKTLPYFLLCGLSGAVCTIAFLVLNAVLTPHVGSNQAGGDPDISFKTPQGTVTVDTRKLERAAQDMEALAKKMEAAATGKDASVRNNGIDAAGKAVGSVLSALGGNAERATLTGTQIKAYLPERLADLERTAFETDGAAVAGLEAGTGKATYGRGKRTVRLEILDAGALGALGAIAARVQTDGEKVDEQTTERTIRQGKRVVHETARKDGSSAAYKVTLANGIEVNAQAQGLTLAELKKALEEVDLQALEQVK